MEFFNNLICLFPGQAEACHEDRMTVAYQTKVAAGSFPEWECLQSFLANIPKRDVYSVELVNDREERFTLSVTTEKTLTEEYLNESEGEELSVYFKIDKKNVDKRITIYAYNTFTAALCELSPMGIMTFFHEQLKNSEKLTFEVLDENICWQTESIAFLAREKSASLSSDRQEKLRLCGWNAHFSNFSQYELLPSDFCVTKGQCHERLAPLFERIKTLLSMAYIANTSRLEGNEILLQFNVFSSKQHRIPVNTLPPNSAWYSLFSWIYQLDSHASDKLAIARNVIGLYCNHADVSAIDESLISSIHTNFQIYLKSNVERYLEAKNKVGEYICSVSIKIQEQVNTLTLSLAHNIIAVGVFILSTMLPKMLFENRLVINESMRWVILVILFCSLGYTMLACSNFNASLLFTKDIFDELKDNYKPIFSIEEIDELFEKGHIDSKIQKAKTKRNWILFFWIAILLFLGLMVDLHTPVPWLHAILKH
ncbi:MAG: hypothetical protein K6E31_06800 [bacterium]|nr:hypothetical protein [bacterium]